MLKTTYDNAGQPLTIDLNGQVETRSHDARGRLLAVTYADGQSIAYQYDEVGNRTKLTTQTRVVDYGHDALNRLTTVTEQPSVALNQAAPKTTRYSYTEVGSRASIEHPNGTRVDYVYNRRNQLTRMLHTKAATVLLGLSYLLNPDGSRASIIEQTHAVDAQQQALFNTDGSPQLEQQRRTDYVYDDLKRLVHEAVDARIDSNDRVTSWTYDAVGNRQTQSQQTGIGALAGTASRREAITYTYDANDRLLTETTATTTDAGATSATAATTHRYDLNGNLLETSKPNEVERYRWTSENRLAQHEKTANGQTAITQYAYTADGIRNKIVSNANTPNAITTRQLIDPVQSYAQVIEETIAVGSQPAQLKAVYTHGDDLIAQHALKNSDGTPATSGTSYLHYDGLGTTRLLTNASGNVTDRYTYQAFGDIDEAASSYAFGSSAATDYLFTGEQYDPNLGFYYLRARYMDPTNGRFASLDSYMGNDNDPASLHKYVYANANPAMYTDPSGNESLISIGMAINIVGIGSTAIHAGFRIAEGDYEGAAKEAARDAVFWAMGAGVGKVIAPLGKAAMGLFARTFMVPLEIGLARSGQVLTRNMNAVMARAGLSKPAGWQAHHIVGEAYPEGQMAMAILRRFKIDVNSPLNGVFLPGCGAKGSAGITGLAVHCGKHVQEYERYVLQQLEGATSESAVVNAISRIRDELLHGDLFLNARGNL